MNGFNVQGGLEMRFRRLLTDLIRQTNREIKRRRSLQKHLKTYMGKRLVLNVAGDASYRFMVGPDGISLETGKRLRAKPADMQLRMDGDRLNRIIRHRRLRLTDILSIKHKNITLKEVMLAKEIHKEYLSRPSYRRRKH
jgi:hypothetical protein